MKRLLYLIIMSALTLPTLLSCSSDDEQDVVMTENVSEEDADAEAVIVNRIRNCSKIYTAEVHMHKVIVADDPMKIGGDVFGKKVNIDIPLGERKIAIPMDGVAKAYIDFSKFSEDNVKIDGDDIIVELPKPSVVLTSTTINHDEIKKNVSLFRSNFSDAEITQYSKKGREEIIKAVPKSGVLEKAQSGAAAVIVPMLQQLGYKDKNIRVVFDDSVTSDPFNFLKKNLIVK